MLRQELQSYLNRVFPFSKIENEDSLFGQVHIRFELGGNKANGTFERVNQSTERALTIFYDTFQNPSNEIFVLIYEYGGENIIISDNDYLHKQFPTDSFAKFYKQLEMVNIHDPFAEENEILEKEMVRIITGKLPVKDINARNILNGIANCEMGFEPRINQTIYFFDPSTDKAFQMYDDRGCFVWSDDASKIKDIYLKRNDWIVEYHRSTIETFLKE